MEGGGGEVISWLLPWFCCADDVQDAEEDEFVYHGDEAFLRENAGVAE